MKVNQIAQSIQTQQVQKKGRAPEPAPVQTPGSDKVEISVEARKLQDTQNATAAALNAVKNTPDVREDKIAEVRQKIVEGFYNQSNIATVLADKLLKEFGL